MRYRTGGKLIHHRPLLEANPTTSYTNFTAYGDHPSFTKIGECLLTFNAEGEKTLNLTITREDLDWLNYIFKGYERTK